MRRVRVVIKGDVQNVGFRSWTRHKAGHYGILGWVKNNPDGSVEAVLEVDVDTKIDQILEDFKRGPPGSYVESVDITEEPFIGEFKGFDIIA